MISLAFRSICFCMAPVMFSWVLEAYRTNGPTLGNSFITVCFGDDCFCSYFLYLVSSRS